MSIEICLNTAVLGVLYHVCFIVFFYLALSVEVLINKLLLCIYFFCDCEMESLVILVNMSHFVT